MAANNKYSVIGRYAQGREIVAFELANLSTNVHQRYTVNQVAYLVGRGSVLNCQGQIYNGKVLFRGVGCSLDQLPTVMEKPAEELNGAEAPIKNTENISGPARRNATNDQLMGQMTLVARVKVEETSKKTLGYDFKNVGGTTGTLWRGEVLKAAREGKVTNARVNSANGKEILRSRGTTPEEQLSNLPIRIATPEELKKLGVKVENSDDKAQAEKNRAAEVSKIANVYKEAIDDVIFDLDTKGFAYSIVDVNREVIPEAELNSIELYEDFLKAQVLGTFMVIRLKTKQGHMAELSFDVDSNETYNKKPSYVITSAMLVKKDKGERPRRAGNFSITLDSKTDKNDIYLKTMSLISNGFNYNSNDLGDKLVNLSKSLFNYLSSVVDERVLPSTEVHKKYTSDTNYAESTLKSMAKDIEDGVAKSCALSYKLTNTETAGLKNIMLGTIEALYTVDGTFKIELKDSKSDKVSESIVEENFDADIESTDRVVKSAVDSLDFSKLNIEIKIVSNEEIYWGQIEQNIIAIKNAAEDYLNDKVDEYPFTVDGKDRYSDSVIKQYIDGIKSGENNLNLEYVFKDDISGEGRPLGFATLHIKKIESSNKFVANMILKDKNNELFQTSEEYMLSKMPTLCHIEMREKLDTLNFKGLFAKSISTIEEKLDSLYGLAVSNINEKAKKFGLAAIELEDVDRHEYLATVAKYMLGKANGSLGFNIHIVEAKPGVAVGDIHVEFDTSDEHISKLDKAFATGLDAGTAKELTRTSEFVHDSSVMLISKLFNAFDFSVFVPKVEAFASLIAVGVNAIYGLAIPGLHDGTPVIRYSDTNGVKVLTEGNGLVQGNFPGGFDISEDIINKACEAATNGADTVKVSVTTKYYNLDFIIKNNDTFRIVYMDNSNRKPKLVATKEQPILLKDTETFEPVLAKIYQSTIEVIIELQPLMKKAVDSGEEFE